MHVQQHWKTSPGQVASGLQQAARPSTLVEGDKIHAVYAIHQAKFRFTDDPRDLRIRPRCLNGSDDR
jgi:hypothetical protein